MDTGNKLKLGLFGANCSGGRSLTRVPERWKADWDETLAMAQMADAAGIDFLLPIGRWKGYGGETDWQGTSYETITWATGLLAATHRITVFGTGPRAVVPPRYRREADGDGRSRRPRSLRAQHRRGLERRRVCDVRLRSEGVRVKPKPYGGTRPIIMNAGASPDGQAFAIENCDAYFTGVRMSSFDEASGVMVPAVEQATAHVAAVRAKAAAIGREIGVFTRAEITCRPTQREAADYYRYWVDEMADWGAVDHQMKISRKMTPDMPDYVERRKQHLHGFPVVGAPDRVAAMLAQLSEAGFNGVGISLVNYLDELPYLRDELLPRLERLGLRLPA